jgi:nitrate reductase delta subunit
MHADTATWDAFAGLFAYPGGQRERLRGEWGPRVLTRFPELEPALTPLLELVEQRGEGECEELFTRTFDGSAERALELGWHLHGENYARGALLVRLRAMLRANELDEGSELPDHVSNVLRLIGRVDATTSRALQEQVLAPALDKVLVGCGEDDNPYKHALAGLREALRETDGERSAT